LNPPRFDVDLDAVAHNVRQWRASFPDREVWAVVKSDAYGVGAVAVARACVAAGASRLVVFDVEEARPLRAAGVDAPVVQVFATPAADVPAATQLRVTPSVEDESGARALSDFAGWRARRVSAQVAVDTGTGWSGVWASRAGEFARAVRALPGMIWDGAWTHVAGRDSMDAQMRAFATAVAAMRAEGLEIPNVHVAATGPALWGRSSGALRIGIGLYGSTMGESAGAPSLRTALRVMAKAIAVKRFEVATPLGYGGRDVASPGESVATLRIGYADGLPQSLAEGGGIAKLAGVACPIAGAIGMNCTMVRVPEGAEVRVGDDALIVGDEDGVRIDEVAARASLIPHALLASLAGGMCVRLRRGAPS
jgi:alanine racemase